MSEKTDWKKLAGKLARALHEVVTGNGGNATDALIEVRKAGLEVSDERKD